MSTSRRPTLAVRIHLYPALDDSDDHLASMVEVDLLGDKCRLTLWSFGTEDEWERFCVGDRRGLWRLTGDLDIDGAKALHLALQEFMNGEEDS